MIWVAWRQQRYVWWGLCVVTVALVAWAVVSGLRVESLWHEYHAPPCRGGNGFAATYVNYCQRLGVEQQGAMAHDSIIALFAQVLAVAAGTLLGVGVAGEFERTTTRLAWTQSVTRTRWLATKVSVGAVSMSLLLGPLCVTCWWWVRAARFAPRVTPTAFPVAGVMLGAYGLFAFALAVFLGALIRRTGWTTAAVVVAFALVLFGVQTDLRPHLAPLHVQSVTYYSISKGSVTAIVPTVYAPTTSWTVFQGYVHEPWNGAVPTWPTVLRANNQLQNCLARAGAGDLAHENECLRTLDLRNVQIYVANSEFWDLQLREGGLYLGASLLFIALGVVVVRRVRA